MAAGETIYTWTDESGVVHMTNVPPVQSDQKVDIIEMKSPAITVAPEIQYAQPDDQPPPQNGPESDINIAGMTLSIQGRVSLLFDTGSTNITLHRGIAEKLSIKDSMKGSVRVAGGELIDAEAVILDSVTVGPHKGKNLAAGIIEHTGPAVAFDGLLGMNFLKNHEYTINFENKTLLWNK